jgi:hypothetical protein
VKKLFKISLFGLSAIIFTIGVVTGIYFWTTLPEQQINQWVGYYLSAKTGYKIHVDKVNRDIWRRIEIDNLTVSFESETLSFPIAQIKHLETAYSLRGLISQEISLSGLKINGLKLDVPFDDKGHLAIPKKAGAANPDKPPQIPEIAISDFALDSVEININIPDNPKQLFITALDGSLVANNSALAIKIDSMQSYYPDKDFKLDSCSAILKYGNNELSIEKFGLKTKLSRLSLNGLIRNLKSPEYNFSYVLNELNLDEVTSLTGVKLSGQAAVEGTIEGNLREFIGTASGNVSLFGRYIKDFKTKYHYNNRRVDFSDFSGLVFEAPLLGDGYLDFNANPAQYGYKGTVTELNLQNIGLTLYSLFTGDITLTGQGLSEQKMKMSVDMHLYKADIDIYHFHEAIGKINFDMKQLTFEPNFRTRYKDTWVEYGGFLEYKGNISIEGDADLANLANFQNQFFITDLDGRGKGHFIVSGPTLDFTVDGNFQSDSCRFYGLTSKAFDLDLNLTTFISHQTGVVNGHFKAGDLYTIPVDTAYFRVSVAGDRYFLDTVFCRNTNNIMEFSGSVDNTVLPPLFVVDTMRTILWNDTVYSAHPMKMDVDSTLVRFRDFVLAYKSGRAEMSGDITYENEMKLDLKANGFEISPIVKYFSFDRKLSGVLSGRMTVGGNFDLPIFTADYSIDDFAIDSVVQGDFQMKASYANRVLEVSSAEIAGESMLFQLSGKFPIEMSFTYTGDRLIEQPFIAQISASGTDLPIVPVFVKSIDYVHGKYSAAVEISGTYDHPVAAGTFSMADGSVKALELIDPISGINIAGRMENDLIYVDKIEAFITQSKSNFGSRFDGYPLQGRSPGTTPGKINGNGTIKLLGIGLFDYNLNLSGKDCQFYTESYDIHGRANLDLKVTGSSPPVVNGIVELIRLDMNEPFGTFYVGITDKTEILEDSTMWDLDLDVTAPNNLWIKNPDADMEMTGNVQVLRKAGIQNLLGQLEVIRGNFFLFNYKFKIKSGQMDFNNISILDPTINFDVSTRVRETASASLMNQTNPGYEDLDLLISGTLSKPKIQSASDSLYSDEDILKILVSNRFSVSTNSGKSGGLGENILANMLDILYTQTNRIPVFDEIDISPYSDSLGQTQVSVAKYLSPKIFVRYSRRGISQTTGETIGIEYMLNNNLSFEGKQGTKNEGISFDLKLKYEF